jgi:hypothetical protein
VLLQQGNTIEALGKYDEVLKFASDCKQLEEARDILLVHILETAYKQAEKKYWLRFNPSALKLPHVTGGKGSDQRQSARVDRRPAVTGHVRSVIALK